MPRIRIRSNRRHSKNNMFADKLLALHVVIHITGKSLSMDPCIINLIHGYSRFIVSYSVYLHPKGNVYSHSNGITVVRSTPVEVERITSPRKSLFSDCI